MGSEINGRLMGVRLQLNSKPICQGQARQVGRQAKVKIGERNTLEIAKTHISSIK